MKGLGQRLQAPLGWFSTPQAAFVRRRGLWFVVSFLVVTLATVVYAQTTTTRWTATAYAEVNSGAGGGGPGDALNAEQLAASYAYVIPSDGAILQRVASATGQTLGRVRASLDVYADVNSAELVLSYTARSPSTALKGAKVLADSVANGVRGNQALAAGVATITGLPTDAVPTGRLRVVAFGLLAALLVALTISLALERFDPRIDDETELEEVLGVPVTSLQGLTGSGITTLVSRWRVEGGWSRPLVLATTRGTKTLADDLVRRLAREGLAAPMVVSQSPDGGVISAISGAFTVLVVERGAAAREVVAVAARLGLVACEPRWAVLAEPGSSPSLRVGAGDPSAVPEGGTPASAVGPASQFPTEAPLSARELARLFADVGPSVEAVSPPGEGSASHRTEG